MKANNIIKITLFGTFIAIFLIIAIPTAYKVMNVSRQKEDMVNQKLITEKAKKCIYDGKCTTNTVTLKTLYSLNYIKDKVINPYDKTFYSEDSYVVITRENPTVHLQ